VCDRLIAYTVVGEHRLGRPPAHGAPRVSPPTGRDAHRGMGRWERCPVKVPRASGSRSGSLERARRHLALRHPLGSIVIRHQRPLESTPADRVVGYGAESLIRLLRVRLDPLQFLGLHRHVAVHVVVPLPVKLDDLLAVSAANTVLRYLRANSVRFCASALVRMVGLRRTNWRNRSRTRQKKRGRPHRTLPRGFPGKKRFRTRDCVSKVRSLLSAVVRRPSRSGFPPIETSSRGCVPRRPSPRMRRTLTPCARETFRRARALPRAIRR
jgi:hypothetical protein